MRNATIYRYLLSIIILLASAIAYAQIPLGPYHYEHEYVQRCSSEPSFEWHMMTFDTTGIYFDTVRPYLETDLHTVYVLHLEFKDTITVNQRIDMRRGTTIHYRNLEITHDGVYADTTRATTDCDTIYRLVVNYSEDFHRYDTLHLCQSNLPYNWMGQRVIVGGDYSYTYHRDGYDSIIHMFMRVHNPIKRTVHRSLCTNESITLGTQVITEPGSYFLAEMNEYGCIDTTYLEVTSASLAYYKQVISFCESAGIRHRNGELFKDHRTYFDTLPRAQQCDSVVETEYIPTPAFYQEQLATIYTGETYLWGYDHKEYTGDTTVRYVYPGSNGCDSIYVLRLSTIYEVPITIYACQGDTVLYKRHRVTSNTPLPIRDTLKTIHGGDSVLLVYFQFYPRYYFLEHTTLCRGEKVKWTGHTDLHGDTIVLGVAGSYYDRKETIHGCDSIYEMQVTNYTPVIFDTTIVVCNDSLENFRWRDWEGNYHPWGIANVDTTIVVELPHTPVEQMHDYWASDGWHRALSGGCPNIWQMRLVVKECGRDTVPICPESHVWINGVEYLAPGDYTQRWATSSDVNAMDTICRYHVYPAQAVDEGIYDTVRICASEAPYVWHDYRYGQTGTYTETLQTAEGCDSLVHLYLEVYPTYITSEVTRNMCQGDSLWIHDRKITTSGVYYDTIYSRYGCDSIIRYVVNFTRNYFFEETDHFKQGTAYRWHRHGLVRWLTEPGVYMDSCQTVNGCDSIYRLTLSEDQPYHFYDTIYVCQNELPYMWNNHQAHGDTVLYHNLQTKHGMDSIYELAVYTYPTYRVHQYVTLCRGENFQINGQIATQSGVYTDHQYSQQGCDSITYYHVNFYPTYFIEDEAHILPGMSYEWVGHDTIIRSPGLYTDSMVSVLTGCDSIYQLRVVEDQQFEYYETKRICQSETPYEWHGYQLYASADTSYTYISPDRTPYYYHLSLTVNPVVEQTLNYDQCLGERLTINGRDYTSTCHFSDTLFTREGCDSVVHYFVNFHAPFYKKDTMHFEQGTSITWHGRILDQPGFYFDSLQTSHGCDSVFQLRLIKDQPYHFHDTIYICKSELPYVWNGMRAYGDTALIDHNITQYGLDSIYERRVKIYPSYHIEQSVTRCHNQPFFFKGQSITQTGVYTDSLMTQYGCDSIVTYRVNFLPTYYFEQEAHFVSNTSYNWVGHDTILSVPGIYTDSLVSSVTGCDSVYRLYLIEDNLFLYYDTIQRCQNETPYEWHGYALYSSTDTTRVIVSSDGSHTIYHLHLTVHPIRESTVRINRCLGESFMLDGKYISSSCRFNDTLFTDNGCDSIIHYIINFHPTYYQRDTMYFRHGTSVTWRGRNLNIAGTYDDTIPTQFGCDSIYHLLLIESQQYVKYDTVSVCASELPYQWHIHRLDTTGNYSYVQEDSLFYIHFKVLPTYLFESTVDLYCDNATYSFFGRALTETDTVYEQRLQTIHGCDSIYRVRLVRQEKRFTPVQITICSNETLHIADTVVSSACQFTRIYPSSQGCDSTVLYIINRLPSLKKTYVDAFCENDVYVWHRRPPFSDTILTRPGTYRYSFPIEAGCDSTYELRLSTTKVPRWDTIIYFCADEPITYHGQVYTSSVTFTEQHISASGCDSLRYYHYRLIPYCTPWIQYKRCPGSSYVFNGYTYDTDGRYRMILHADTMKRFEVASYPQYEYTKDIGVFCDSVNYGGKTYFTRGNNQASFMVDRYMRSQYGCDSIEHVKMTIYQSAANLPVSLSIPDYASVLFDGKFYSTTGEYKRPLHTSHGCDSTITLLLNVEPTSNPGMLQVYYCQDDPQPVNVFGKEYAPLKDTMIIDTISSNEGGLLIVRKAQVNIESSFTITDMQIDKEACADYSVPFYMNFHTSGGYPSHYEMKFLSNDMGVIPPDQSGDISATTHSIDFSMLGQERCIQPGVYPYRLKLTGHRCHLSDTTFWGEMKVLYPATIMEANWDNMVALVNEKYNLGGWEFEPPYTWSIRSASGEDKTAYVSPANSDQPYLASDYLRDGDQIVVYLKRKGYAAMLPSCTFTFYSVPSSKQSTTYVTPTMVHKSSKMTITSSKAGEYSIVNHVGEVYQKGHYSSGEQQIQAPTTAGCYLMLLTSEEEAPYAQKFIVY